MTPPRAGSPEHPRWWDALNPLGSIRAQVALVLAVLGTGFTLFYSNRAAEALEARIEADAGPLFETLAGSIRERIDRGMYERFRELQVAAAMPMFRDPAAPEAGRRAAINHLNDTEEQYAWIGFANAEGRVVVGSGGLREDLSVGDEGWFKAVAGGGTYLGNVQDAFDLVGRVPRSNSSRLEVFDLAVPVTDVNGKFLGAIWASLRWSWVEQQQDSVVPESARRRLLGVTIYSADQEVLLDTGRDIWGVPLPYPPVPVSARGQQSLRGYLRQDDEATVYLTGYALTRGYRNMRGLGWMIAVRQPARRSFSEVGALRADIRLIGFAATAFIVAGGWGFAGLLVQRLRAIENAAEYIRDGDPLALIPRQDGRGDLARMGRSLSRMVASLRGHADGKTTGKSTRPPGPGAA